MSDRKRAQAFAQAEANARRGFHAWVVLRDHNGNYRVEKLLREDNPRAETILAVFVKGESR